MQKLIVILEELLLEVVNYLIKEFIYIGKKAAEFRESWRLIFRENLLLLEG